ncbi:MAG: cellulase family glycosylhydrolase [Propionibacteriaceae bacterium]|jgi:xylan 1,4-beta-xylosidase|nr:cellulase family glycosylhydrolase [Propionibacteriaceae bacterium]
MTQIIIPTEPTGVLNQAWRQCVGTGRMNLALRADYQASLAKVQSDIGFRYIRGHGLLSDDMGIFRQAESVTRYSYTYLDQMVDSFLAVGVKPFLELGFMPSGMASGSDTVFWWKGNITPPADYDQWVRLVQAVLRHLISRYGLAEVATWPIEVWNEPNLTVFWKDADQAEYFRLYDATARAIKQVDATLQVGGPAISPGSDQWYSDFADYVLAHDTPVDFISGHAYASGPTQHIPFGTYQTLEPPQWLLDQFASPRDRIRDKGRLSQLPTHITEFNTSYCPDNPIHDTAYNAAFLAPVVAFGGQYADSYSYWTFCDVFEEANIPTSFFHGGFGLLGYRQIRKPTYHLYAFMAKMGSQIMSSGPDHLVTRHEDGRLTILAWQPLGGTSDGVYGSAPFDHHITVDVNCATDRLAMVRRRVNEHMGNAWTAWRELGRPQAPDLHTLDLLDEASEPVVEHASYLAENGRVNLELTLDQHEVTLIELIPVVAEVHEGLDDGRLLGQEN